LRLNWAGVMVPNLCVLVTGNAKASLSTSKSFRD
jgi:hypothetical protein